MSYTESIKRPFTNSKVLGIVIAFYFVANAISVGSIILDSSEELTPIKIGALLLSMLITLIPIGYSVMCAKTAHLESLPKFTNIKRLFTLGTGTMAIGIIYSIPILIFIYVVILSMDLTSFMVAGPSFESIPNLILFFLLMLATILLIPIALVRYVKEESFIKAFNLNIIIKKIFTKKYLLTFILAGVYTILVSLIVAYLNIVTQSTIILPWLFSAVSSTLIAITIMTMYGKAV